ncbi:MAG TPA: hypothetical protein VG273_27390 [Bryobacteraceae bacterium]|jgi:hypothetical protein|nr:hypothetical protein [Bryobacteraceae bacterium]
MPYSRFLIAILALGAAAGVYAQSGSDPVAQLDRKVRDGKAQLKFDEYDGYLRSVLAALNIPVESQMAVFSKTSVQAMRIEPERPRVLYFNDSTIVGWVPGGFIEVATQDPHEGMKFYALDQRQWVHDERMEKPAAAREPLFERRQDCLHCHTSASTLVTSVSPTPDGVPVFHLGSLNTDQRTPFEKLWGGWYVTGKSGAAHHMGNVTVTDPQHPEPLVSEQLDSLEGRVDTRIYPAPYSDIAALMVFEHQMHMMNLLSHATPAAEVVDYMLFLNEPALKDRVTGTSGFTEKFAARGPFDSKGRSLRQLDLKTRTMRYPCSYMIYSAAFDALPDATREAIYKQMWRILSGDVKSRLALADRRNVVEILRATKPGLPAYFQTVNR